MKKSILFLALLFSAGMFSTLNVLTAYSQCDNEVGACKISDLKKEPPIEDLLNPTAKSNGFASGFASGIPDVNPPSLQWRSNDMKIQNAEPTQSSQKQSLRQFIGSLLRSSR